MNKPKLYCERNAYPEYIKSLHKEEKIDIVHFHIEEKFKAAKRATPSGALWRKEIYPWKEDSYPWQHNCSEKYKAIFEIVKKIDDSLHLDSAYKSQCKYFLTRDDSDIIRNKNELEKILGLKIFDPIEEKESFLKDLDLSET
jgi:hypothetical protein